MPPPLVTGAAQVRQQLAGLLFLAVLGGLVALAVALYQKAFTPVVLVAVEAGKVGTSCRPGAT
jgi:phospholipid/cholesterol/gamma-HCH transport system substrate-binding protein